jgi:hypothetical protein
VNVFGLLELLEELVKFGHLIAPHPPLFSNGERAAGRVESGYF